MIEYKELSFTRNFWYTVIIVAVIEHIIAKHLDKWYGGGLPKQNSRWAYNFLSFLQVLFDFDRF